MVARVPGTPGQLVAGRFELLEELGAGASATVFRALDRVTDELVALKVIPEQGDEALEVLRRELRAARRISHPAVVRTHELFLLEGGLALSMELVEGPTLAERLGAGPLDRAAWLGLAEDLARALAAAHRAGVVHRDLKPSNIVLRGGRAVVTDFGISLIDRAPRAEEDWLGTPLYMAPEQLRGEPVTPAVDVYAAGLVLFEAATGRLPGDGLEAVQRLFRRVEEPAPALGPLRPDLPPELGLVVDRCLERDPVARYADGLELRAALHVVMPGRLSSAA